MPKFMGRVIMKANTRRPITKIAPRLVFLALAAIAASLVACSTTEPDVHIPLQDMNSQIQLTAPPDANNTFKLGDLIDLLVINRTTDAIVLPNDYGIKIFTRADGKWHPERNDFEYSNQGEHIILPNGSAFPSG